MSGLRSADPCGGAREVARDKIGSGETHGPYAAVRVIPLGVEHAFANEDFPAVVDHEAMDAR